MSRTLKDLNIPFIADLDDPTPFADLEGVVNVNSPEKMLEGWSFEAEVGDWNTVQSGLLALLSQNRRAVARIVVPPGNPRIDFRGRNQRKGWNGTGFLVAKNILLTNHHVINSLEIGEVGTAEFDYEILPEDLFADRQNAQPATTAVRLDPSRLFVTSKARGGGLDYTFIWIDGIASEHFGCVPMERASFTAEQYDPTFIVHHPKGRLKEVSLDDTELLRMRSTVIHYAADTDYGSSGAPVFDRNGRLIALHHARNDDGAVKLVDGRKVSVVNEGIKIAAIAIDLENRTKRSGGDAECAKTILNAIKGSDTLTSFFGGLGRHTDADTDVEAVVDVYRGTEQDVDIGFWNIEWLANRYKDEDKLKAAATVITDLNLDIWGLVEVSPPAVEALVDMLADNFGEEYGFALSEPDAGEHKQSTAMIWRTQTVSGEKQDWPAAIERLWDRMNSPA